MVTFGTIHWRSRTVEVQVGRISVRQHATGKHVTDLVTVLDSRVMTDVVRYRIVVD